MNESQNFLLELVGNGDLSNVVASASGDKPGAVGGHLATFWRVGHT